MLLHKDKLMKATRLNSQWSMYQPFTSELVKEKATYKLIRIGEDGFRKVVSVEEREEYKKITNTDNNSIYLFSTVKFDLMKAAYHTGNAELSERCYKRYADAYTIDGIKWEGDPRRTARELASSGVPLPDKLFSIMMYIMA